MRIRLFRLVEININNNEIHKTILWEGCFRDNELVNLKKGDGISCRGESKKGLKFYEMFVPEVNLWVRSEAPFRAVNKSLKKFED